MVWLIHRPSEEALEILMSDFRKNKKADQAARAQIANRVGLPEQWVQVPFSKPLLSLC